MINLHPSKNQCQTPQSYSNSWWVRRTVPIDSGLERKSYFSSYASVLSLDSGSTLGRKGWLGASYPIGSTMVSSSADALAASAFSCSSASSLRSPLFLKQLLWDFEMNSFRPSWLLPSSYSSPTDGYRKTTEARS